MEINQLQSTIVDALDDVKAHDIQVLNTSEITALFDRVIVASGTSNRQTRALAKHVANKVIENGGEILSMEGFETGEWVLVDAVDVIVHLMQPNIREYYNLEELWGTRGAPVKSVTPNATAPR